MVVAVGLTLMTRMVMVVGPMLPRVLMIVHIRAALVGMLMAVFVSVLVGVQMPVLVFSFHSNDSFLWVDESSMDSLMLMFRLNLRVTPFKMPCN